jgi:uncharacterized protein YjeT (DUF2065 family)
MISIIILAVGLVLCVEGLVFALAPSRLEDVLEALRQMSPETRRMIGLAALGIGVFLVWLSRYIGS